jgi:hypothetical protein
MYAHLVRVGVLDASDAPYVLINAVDTRNAMDSRCLAIINILFSMRELDPDVVNPGDNSLLSRAILPGHMDVVDTYLDSCPGRVPLMKSVGKRLRVAAPSRRRETQNGR